ncbi:MAG: hypothetical protein JXA77_11255 [Bacteroidales bacterium]|nr:hypothetical protein [Bacteroidales bacterium]MBN2819070.1 hypothetical protein [Bacteroidales bacterium]
MNRIHEHTRGRTKNSKRYFFEIFLTLSLIAGTYSCERQTNWTLEESGKIPVIDAIITNELKNHEVYFYSSSTSLNQAPEGISGAEIILKAGTNTYTFSEKNDKAGVYISDEAFRGAAGIEYYLIVIYDNQSDTAKAELVAISKLQEMIIVNYDSAYRYVYYDDSSPSMTYLSYNWSNNTDFCEKYGSCAATQVFYTINLLDINQTFAPDKQIISFPKGTTLARAKYSLSDEHQRFIRSLLIETEWRGGIFDTEQGNVPTNFKHGVQGWFGVCMVLRDTLVFND